MLTTFNSWYLLQGEPIRVAVIAGIVAVLCAVLAGIVALLVAWVQGRISRRGVKAQERTIYLSLIERRALWLDHAVQTWGAWIEQQEQRIEAILSNEPLPTNDPLHAIAHCRRQARWLFGPEVDEFLERLEVSVREYSRCRLAVRELGMMELAERRADAGQRHQEFSNSLAEMVALQGDLASITRPYLYVGDIRATGIPHRMTVRRRSGSVASWLFNSGSR